MIAKLASGLLLAAALLPAQAVIEGKVVNSATKLGIEGVSVRFFTGRGPDYETRSGAQGEFRLTDVAEGNYRTLLQRTGYEVKQTGLELQPGDVPLYVSASRAVAITLEMQPITEIRGYVTDPDGKPAQNAAVELDGPMTNNRNRAQVFPGKDGAFVFEGILPGSFSLIARAAPAPVLKDNQRVATVDTYWPSITDPAVAQKILVTGAVPISSYDIQLQRRPVYRVAGTVQTPEGEPTKGAIVNLVRIRPARYVPPSTGANSNVAYLPMFEYDFVGSANASKDGAFEFQTVQDGTWSVQVTGPLNRDEPPSLEKQPRAQATVHVNGKDVHDIDLHLQNSFSLEATIEEEAAPERTRSKSNVFSLIDGRLVPTEPRMLQSLLMPQRDGPSRFILVYPGQYRFYAISAPGPGMYVSRVLLGGDDVLGKVMTLNASSPPLRIICKQGAGTIQANIEKHAPGTILLLPGLGPSVDPPRGAVPLNDKTSQFANLRPGEYYIAAFDRVDDTRLADPLFVASLISLAKRVSVEEKGNVTVELPLNRWPE